MGTLKSARFRLLPPLFAAAAVLAACADSPKGPTYDEVINAYVGNTEANLVSAWGIPDGSHQLSTGGRVLEYVRKQGANTICTTRFTIDRTGRVVKTWYKGSACG